MNRLTFISLSLCMSYLLFNSANCLAEATDVRVCTSCSSQYDFNQYALYHAPSQSNGVQAILYVGNPNTNTVYKITYEWGWRNFLGEWVTIDDSVPGTTEETNDFEFYYPYFVADKAAYTSVAPPDGAGVGSFNTGMQSSVCRVLSDNPAWGDISEKVAEGGLSFIFYLISVERQSAVAAFATP